MSVPAAAKPVPVPALSGPLPVLARALRPAGALGPASALLANVGHMPVTYPFPCVNSS